MIFRDFVEALCYVSSEEITAKAALTLLRVAIGDDHVKSIFPTKDAELLIKSYMRSNRNLSKPVAQEIREAFNETPDNRRNLKESLCEQCFCNKERIARTMEAFGKYCPDLQKMTETKVLKRKGTELLLDLFIDMLKKAENKYRKVQDNQTKQSEAKQNTSPDSLQQAANSINIVNAQSDCSIVSSYTISDEEKTAILNLCGLISGTLQDIKHKIEAIDRKDHELRGLSENETNRRWKAYLEFELNTIKNDLKKQYSELKKYCSDASKLLENRQHLHQSFKAIYDIATQIYKGEYKEICPETFHYSALSALVSSYQKNYEKLKAYIQSR